jgi:uncharacterized damage-inducible protein DinB
MDDRRREYAAKEAEGWATLGAALEAIPRERWTEEGVVPGWSVKHVLRHFTGWIERCASKLQETPEEAAAAEPLTDERMHEMNAGFAAEADGMHVDAAWSGLVDARERLLGVWSSVDQIDEAGYTRFAGETFEHYDEHLEELRHFAAADRDG